MDNTTLKFVDAYPVGVAGLCAAAVRSFCFFLHPVNICELNACDTCLARTSTRIMSRRIVSA